MSEEESAQQLGGESLDLDHEFYTATRLKHASPEHLHLTTRRCFIGPIPDGWLRSHRKSWYRHYIAGNYSSRAATFTASKNISHERRTTGLDVPKLTSTFATSFPQPEDVDDEEDEEDAAAENEDRLGAQGDVLKDHEDNLRQLEGANELVTGDTNEASTPTVAVEPSSALDVPIEDSGEPQLGQSSEGRTPSFVTAPTKKARDTLQPEPGLDNVGTSPPGQSFITAAEAPRKDPKSSEPGSPETRKLSRASFEPDDPGRPSIVSSPNTIGATNSTAALLPPKTNEDGKIPSIKDAETVQTEQNKRGDKRGTVKFKLESAPKPTAIKSIPKLGEDGVRRTWRKLWQEQKHPGGIVKMDKMLVKVDVTMHDLSHDFSENQSLRIETQAIEKWREFIVVCRESTIPDTDFSIQLYKTRVIPARAETQTAKRSTHEILLNPRTTRVNLYSTLDKTLVIWTAWKRGTLIYILRTHSSAGAVEWYTFLRQSLGWRRNTNLQIHVPDLSVSLQLSNPFGELEASITQALTSKSNHAAMKTVEAERAVTSHIIGKSLKMLENNPEWSDVLRTWLEKGRIGLAWKRYDRLEWIHGSNEQRMYGTLAMQRTHDLQLRPKIHYPTSTKNEKESMSEPPPVEGFLIRLTSQKGRVRRFGRMYFKRLYFYTHNQYLCYCRPAKALPPAPPKLVGKAVSKVPSASEIVEQTPLIFAVNPVPEEDGHITWARQNKVTKLQRDEDAARENERRTNTMLQTEGYINLCHVVRVQNIRRGNDEADGNLTGGPDVDFHRPVRDSTADDGKTTSFDEIRTFEVVMCNGLVIRFQAYDEETKQEWISRLSKLVIYWKLRLAEDMTALKSTRHQNLQKLEIDEEMEAWVGQFAQKWEVTRSIASADLYNMCGISCCRAITRAGALYCKPKRHATFQRSGVILSHGKLLLFQGTLRTRTGREIPHIQHQRTVAIDLSNCYIYSGLVAEGDLLYQDQTFDAQHPGHHALPKVYLEDGWTCTDEGIMTCFVIWQPRNRSWFRSTGGGDGDDAEGSAWFSARAGSRTHSARQKLRYVSRLGVPGRSIVFKARSRAERDLWVTSISLEIDRSQQGGKEMRVVKK